MERILLADFRIVVQGTEDDFVAFGKLFYLVESPQLVAFFKRIGDARQEDKYLHHFGFRGQKYENYRNVILLPGRICS